MVPDFALEKIKTSECKAPPHVSNGRNNNHELRAAPVLEILVGQSLVSVCFDLKIS